MHACFAKQTKVHWIACCLKLHRELDRHVTDTSTASSAATWGRHLLRRHSATVKEGLHCCIEGGCLRRPLHTDGSTLRMARCVSDTGSKSAGSPPYDACILTQLAMAIVPGTAASKEQLILIYGG
jgi:hypothetical protein